ncbi:MAG: hypothetical protein P1V20_02590 [Verrucomicrobiales bacterium]|nr:hypothetical protein [Verrucomicrobiales bacterium]
MTTPVHIEAIPPCPHLPETDTPLRASAMKACGKDRGEEFYHLALRCAQSLWLQGLPAQSLLLINRAFGADHDESPAMCVVNPLPYAAAAWVMQNRAEEQFIGNPRRHYQHLATRMVAPRKEARTWRAWACWYMACHIFPDYPADELQIATEGIVEPTLDDIATSLNKAGQPGESDLWISVVHSL